MFLLSSPGLFSANGVDGAWDNRRVMARAKSPGLFSSLLLSCSLFLFSILGLFSSPMMFSLLKQARGLEQAS